MPQRFRTNKGSLEMRTGSRRTYMPGPARSPLAVNRNIHLSPPPLGQAGVPTRADDNVIENRDTAHLADLAETNGKLDVLA